MWSTDDPRWGEEPLPEWVEGFRPHQNTAIAQIVDAYDRGVKTVFLDAPTGSGKTLIAEAVRRVRGGRATYTCSTKTLQRQFCTDYPYSRELKGRSNYPVFHSNSYPHRTADDCQGAEECMYCPSRQQCPYWKAKYRAMASDLAVVNMAYLLAEANFVPNSSIAGRDLTIVDECDTIEGNLMSFVEVRISKRQQKRVGIQPPDRKTVEESWLRWVVGEAIPKTREALSNLPMHPTEPSDVKDFKYLSGLMRNLKLLKDGLIREGSQWVYTDYDRGNIVFKPVRVDTLGEQMLWQHSDRWLLMSASIVSAEEMASSLGLTDRWEVVRVPSTFPPENRPVYDLGLADVTHKNYRAALPKLKKALYIISHMHPNDNILVHTVSYKLAKDLQNVEVPHDIHIYTNSGQRDEVLGQFTGGRKPGLLLAPSLDRGIDLPDDLCRVQIVAKVPFPYLGDKQVNARLYSKGGRLWYTVQTVRTIVQMTGRGVRHEDDSCVTYILDKQFGSNVYKRQNRSLFPDWWTDALIRSGPIVSKLKEVT